MSRRTKGAVLGSAAFLTLVATFVVGLTVGMALRNSDPWIVGNTSTGRLRFGIIPRGNAV
jgi:hypothetical protein